MIITKQTYDNILCKISKTTYETGGILGASNNIINQVVFDEGCTKMKCSYSPNVLFLNKILLDWQDRNIQFFGIFHSHFFGVETLSIGDISYIKSILLAMPDSITQLYFPIVLPEFQKMIPYIARNQNNKISIKRDSLEICNTSSFK